MSHARDLNTRGGSAHARNVMSGSRGLEGPLSKWTNVVQGWQYRWFVLDKESGLLSYYTVREMRFLQKMN